MLAADFAIQDKATVQAISDPIEALVQKVVNVYESTHNIEEEKTMKIHWQDTAILFTDPQNEVLSEQGGAWQLVRDSVHENKTVENMERIFQTARDTGFEVFVSPHYYFPTDDGWQFRDPLGSAMHENHLFARTGALTLDGFSGSGADWLARLKPYIEDARPSWSVRTRYMGPSPMTSSCSCASVGSGR